MHRTDFVIRVLCKFFANGACLKGEYCEFAHHWKAPQIIYALAIKKELVLMVINAYMIISHYGVQSHLYHFHQALLPPFWLWLPFSILALLSACNAKVHASNKRL